MYIPVMEGVLGVYEMSGKTAFLAETAHALWGQGGRWCSKASGAISAK